MLKKVKYVQLLQLKTVPLYMYVDVQIQSRHTNPRAPPRYHFHTNHHQSTTCPSVNRVPPCARPHLSSSRTSSHMIPAQRLGGAHHSPPSAAGTRQDPSSVPPSSLPPPPPRPPARESAPASSGDRVGGRRCS